ncbi:MAG: hypothetical protein BWY74_01321 [Firmicutes bacterium ADurb.Bin419]|nr:MAG: hypothetical protein BWY74_01321 [Firmicutes bacterium ADurb.Bin419]
MGVDIISFINCNGEIFFRAKITSIPLKEESIVKKCIELFNDSEPCIIHRSFAIKKIYFEIKDMFEQVLNKGENVILKDNIPEIIEMIDIDNKENLNKVIIKS